MPHRFTLALSSPPGPASPIHTHTENLGKIQAAFFLGANLIGLDVQGRIVKIFKDSKEEAIVAVVQVRRALKLVEVTHALMFL